MVRYIFSVEASRRFLTFSNFRGKVSTIQDVLSMNVHKSQVVNLCRTISCSFCILYYLLSREKCQNEMFKFPIFKICQWLLSVVKSMAIVAYVSIFQVFLCKMVFKKDIWTIKQFIKSRTMKFVYEVNI